MDVGSQIPRFDCRLSALLYPVSTVRRHFPREGWLSIILCGGNGHNNSKVHCYPEIVFICTAEEIFGDDGRHSFMKWWLFPAIVYFFSKDTSRLLPKAFFYLPHSIFPHHRSTLVIPDWHGLLVRLWGVVLVTNNCEINMYDCVKIFLETKSENIESSRKISPFQ